MIQGEQAFRRKVLRMQSLIFAFVLLFHWACDAELPQPWEPVAPGMILTRNFKVPDFSARKDFHLLPKSYRLGSKACAKAPPDWWGPMINRAGVGGRWHPKDFPLAYAGEFKSTNGEIALLVVQVSHAFSGDGYLARAPELYLIAREFSLKKEGVKLLKEQAFRIGDMQYSCLFAGEAKDRKIVFRTESGTDFDSQATSRKKDWILTVAEDNSVLIMESETVSVGN
jgi:hypothetical protein